MDKELFRKTETKLYNYFNSKRTIAALKYRIEVLENQINEIDRDLKNCNVSIEIESSSPSFEERVQTSGNGTSYAEKEVIRITDLKLKRKLEKEIEIEKTKKEIDNIELDNSILEYNIQFIKLEYYKLLELKYKKKEGEMQIAIKLNMCQSQINKIKQKLIADISRWEEWRKVE